MQADYEDVDVPAGSGASTPAPAAARAPYRAPAKGKFADEDVEDEQVRTAANFSWRVHAWDEA